MKIAIVAFYVMDSSVPLAKYISQAGVEVDLYSLVRQGNQNAYVYDLSPKKQSNGFVNPKIINEIVGEKLLNYLSPVNIRIFVYPNAAGRIKRSFFLNIYHAYKFAKRIKNEKYDIVHVIHLDDSFWRYLYFFLRKEKIVQTLHEVTSHEQKTSRKRTRILSILIKKSIPIIFNSNSSKQRFIDFKKSVSVKTKNENNLEVIRFGLYETYKCFSYGTTTTTKISDEKINILNFGRIVPYKGIQHLIEAVKILQDRYPIHLVIAGKGEPYFDFNEIKSYEFINRNISNEEIVKLIDNCDIVVLPYTSASQSGIPMTVYLYGKPIVATNTAGLKEVVEHLKTGILIDDLNGQTLASSIKMLLEDDSLRLGIEKNIKKRYSEGEFSWPFIAHRTIQFYQRFLYNGRQ
jgi:glycosyltransferase involved in cell wall biosynthesis